jgi:hypothetical protein
MIGVKDVLIDFHGLVKNRLGPYHVVVRVVDGKYNGKYIVSSGKNEFYVGSLQTCIGLKEHAMHWDEPTNYLSGLFNWDMAVYKKHGITCSPFLSTLAGDILLTESNFKPGVLNVN